MAFFTCKDCPDRREGCHIDCEKYNREKAEYEKYKAAVQAEKDVIGHYKRMVCIHNALTAKDRKNRRFGAYKGR